MSNLEAGSAQPPKKKSKTWMIIAAAALVLGCLPCIGIVAAVGVPSFVSYVRRSKTAEAEANLRALFTGAASYYAQEIVGPNGDILTHCTVGPAVTSNVPSDQAQVLSTVPESFSELGFFVADPVYFQYEIVGGPSSCGHGPGEAIYSLRARGNLDGDEQLSLFEMAVGSSPDNELYRAPGIFIENELE